MAIAGGAARGPGMQQWRWRDPGRRGARIWRCAAAAATGVGSESASFPSLLAGGHPPPLTAQLVHASICCLNWICLAYISGSFVMG
uniref:Uncharacterized protein n=1 Tax=Oryza meridionalis TaxID=40149 RepID=A0A0E0F580_9ORYZ